MSPRKFLQLGVILAVLVAGVWLLGRPSGLTAETAARRQAIRQGLAPAGQSSAQSASARDPLAPITPVVVNLAALQAGGNGPDQYGAWLRGEIDLAELDESRATPAEVARLQREALALRPNRNVQLAPRRAGAGVFGQAIGFEALDFTECCGGGSLVPPDPEMAAGPNHLIAVVNAAVEVYSKNGNTLAGPIELNTIFASLPACTAGSIGAFDPTVVYDEEAQRWAIGVDGNGTDYCIAVSTSSNPLGGPWNVYAVPADIGGAFHDYPHTGVGDEYIVVGANQFGGTVGFEGRVWALDKDVMYSGGALTPITFSTTGLYGTPQPLHLHGFDQGTWPSFGNTHYFVTDLYDGCTMQVWEWNIPSAPTIASEIDLCVETGVSGGFPVSVPQMGGSSIEGNDWRFRMFEYRNGSAWTTDTISCNPGSGTVNCVRWVEVDLTGTPSAVQAGVFSSNGEHRIFPDLAVNACGDMAVGYTKSNASMFPGIWVAARKAGDPAGTLRGERLVKAGEVTYIAYDGAPLRWGDYTGMTIDPDGATFWYLGEYSKNLPGEIANWGTFVAGGALPGCTP